MSTDEVPGLSQRALSSSIDEYGRSAKIAYDRHQVRAIKNIVID